MIPLEYVDGVPAWGLRVVRPQRFQDVRYVLQARLFRLRQGALISILLKFYDVPDQPYFIHRVMDLADPAVVQYIETCVQQGRLVAVFKAVGEQDGFQRGLSFDGAQWGKLLQDGLGHNGRSVVDGPAALKAFLEVFNTVSGVKGVEAAWDAVERECGG